MTATFERIKQDIRSLPSADLDHLLRDLQSEYVMPLTDADATSVEAEWDAEIDLRVKEVEDGKVQLISYSELRSGTDALFAELGIRRPA